MSLLEKVLGNASCAKAVQKIIGTLELMVQNARNLRDKAAAQKSGAIGASVKERRMRAKLLDLTPEEREETMDVFMTAMDKNVCGRVMDAIEKIDPGFVEWGKKRLKEAETVSTAYPNRDDILEIPDDGHGEDHLFGNTRKVLAGKRRVADLLEKLEADGFICKGFSVFSVALALASLFNAACLRPQDFFFLVANALYYDKTYNRIKVRLPAEGKQTTAAEKEAARACMEHEVEGAEVVQWWVVMALVGRPFLKKHNNGQLDTAFGPLGTDGKALSEDVFGTVLDIVGRAFFATGNADVNALRTVQDTLAAEHMIELGIPKNSVIKRELARQQRTSEEVSFLYLLHFFRV